MKLYLNFNEYAKFDANSSSNWENFSSALLDSGFTRKSCIGAQGKNEQQTVSVKLKAIVGATNLALRILSCEHTIRARLTLDDGTAYFTGSIRPLADLTVTSYLEPMSASILDDSEYLDYTLSTEASTVNQELYIALSGGTESTSLVHWLISKAMSKQSASVSSRAISNSQIIIDSGVDQTLKASAVVLNVGDNVKDTLESILYEYGLQYRFDESGNVHILQGVPSRSGAVVLNDATMKKSLTIKRGDDSHKGARVIYYKQVKKVCTVAKHSIYDNTYNDDKTLGRGYEWLTEGEVWPPTAYQVKTLEASDLEDSGYEIVKYDLTSISTSLERASDGWFTTNAFTIPTPVQESAVDGIYRYRFYCVGGAYKDLVKSLSLRCACWCIDKNDPQESASSWVKSPTKYTAKYIHSSILANNLVNIIEMRNAAGDVKYTFYLSTCSLTPGQVVHIQSVTSGIDTYAKVLSIKDNGGSRADKLYSIECEGLEAIPDLGDLSVESVAKFMSTNSSEYLTLTPSMSEVSYGSVGTGITVSAKGQAVENLGATLVWYFNGVAVTSTTDTTLLVTADMLHAGVNTISVDATLPGVDWSGRPLQAECTIVMVVPQIEAGYVSAETSTPEYEPYEWDTEPVLWDDQEVGNIDYGPDGVGYCWLKIPKGDGTYQLIQISDTKSPFYLGTQSSVPTQLSNGQALVDGCYFLYYNETPALGYTNGTPYVYENGSWHALSSSDSVYLSAIKNSLQDALLLPSTVDIVSAYNAYFERLAAVEAFIESLKTQNLNIATEMESPNSTASDPSREDFEVNIQAGYKKTDGSNGWEQAPAFGIKSGGAVLLGLCTEADPVSDTQKRFLANESKNFMLSKDRLFIKNAVADGMSAVGCNLYGNFQADIFINSGLILQPNGRSIQSPATKEVQNASMAYDLCIWAKDNSIAFNTMLLCEVSNEPSVEFCVFYTDTSLSGKTTSDWGTFNVDCYVAFYDTNGTNLYTIRSKSYIYYYEVQNTWIFGWAWFGTHTESSRASEGALYGTKTWGFIGTDGGKGIDVSPIQSVDPAEYSLKSYVSDYGQVRDGTVESGGVTCTGFSTAGGQSVYLEVYYGSAYSVILPNLPAAGTSGLASGELYYENGYVRRNN
ncbi:MAG: hypothetical protein WCR70_00305 [Sphaerochaetaceae bacterium]